MATLHLVRHSGPGALASPIPMSRLGDGDLILLLENGVYLGLKDRPEMGWFGHLAQAGRLYVLGPDLEARAIALTDLLEGLTVVDYGGFVELAIRTDKSITW